MTKIIPIAITILRLDEKYLLLKRRNPPYENLWSLVGGKVDIGEHIPSAAIREVMEETGATTISGYTLKGIVSERLVSPTGSLQAHFIIFVGDAHIDSFTPSHQEGDMALFTHDQINDMEGKILPSDYEMFKRFNSQSHDNLAYHEAELVQEDGVYHLNYYREVMH